ncbi:hypothetical protein IWQ56_005847, partial [Coemansia nantahalensis]
MTTSIQTPPQPAWGAAGPASMFSLRWLWPGADRAKDNHGAELALLTEGGLAVTAPAAAAGAPAPAAEAAPRGIPAELLDVEIDEAGNYVHTLAIRSASAGPKHSLVMTHGYFTGIGFYYRNYGALSQVGGWDVYSIDWLGMGRSARPPYKSRRAGSEDERVAYAEEFFVESLEEWRRRMGIERMTLCGHSFGGYMTTLYALRYPERVEKLVLLSPIGVPDAPAGYDDALRRGYGPERNRHRTPPASGNTPEYEEPKSPLGKPGLVQSAIFRTAMVLW